MSNLALGQGSQKTAEKIFKQQRREREKKGGEGGKGGGREGGREREGSGEGEGEGQELLSGSNQSYHLMGTHSDWPARSGAHQRAMDALAGIQVINLNSFIDI